MRFKREDQVLHPLYESTSTRAHAQVPVYTSSVGCKHTVDLAWTRRHLSPDDYDCYATVTGELCLLMDKDIQRRIFYVFTTYTTPHDYTTELGSRSRVNDPGVARSRLKKFRYWF